MQPCFKGVTLAVLGGDSREVILSRSLAAAGAIVRTVGLPEDDYPGIESRPDLPSALEGVQAVILPVPGINDRGEVHLAFAGPPIILSAPLLAALPAGTPVLVGAAREGLRQMAAELGLRLVEVLKRDEVAIHNSIPSAEGAIQIAMEKTPITIHGSRSLVLGFGRTGLTLAGKLKALDSSTAVVARNPAQRARAVAMGMEAYNFNAFVIEAASADFLFNTVPAMVIDQQVLKKLSKAALIVDLASSPGGTDFEEAQRLGIKAVLAPGLPGKVAPVTAGKILADVVPGILAEELQGRY